MNEKISTLTPAPRPIDPNDLLEVAMIDGSSPTGYSTVKVLASSLLPPLPNIPTNIKKFQFPEGTNVFAVGDSITNMPGYIHALCENTGTILNNYAVGGRGILKAVTAAYENNATNPNNWIHTWMASFNDYRRGGMTVKTQNKHYNGLKSFIVNAFIDQAKPASDASVTKTGTWNNLGSGLIGDMAGHIGGNPIYSNVAGSTLTFTFTGQTLAMGYWGVDGVTEKGGDISLTIDGVPVANQSTDGMTDGISDGSDPNTRIQSTFFIKDLMEGSHTAVLTIDAITPGGYIYIDYFATLKHPQNCATVLVYDIPKMNAAGYATVPANASDAVFDGGDLVQQDVIGLFPEYPVIRIKTNDAYDVTTGLSGDNIHPNDVGFSQILSVSLLDLLQSQPQPVLPDMILNTAEGATAETKDVNVQVLRGTTVRVGNAFITYSSSILQISVNRDPRTGLFVSPGEPAPILWMKSGGGECYLRYLIDDGVSGVTQVFNINNNGDVEQGTGRYTYLNGGKENVDGSIRIGVESGAFVWQKRITGVWTTQPF